MQVNLNDQGAVVCMAACQTIIEMMDQSLELLPLLDRRELTVREQQILLIGTRKLLNEARALFADVGLDLIAIAEGTFPQSLRQAIDEIAEKNSGL